MKKTITTALIYTMIYILAHNSLMHRPFSISNSHGTLSYLAPTSMFHKDTAWIHAIYSDHDDRQLIPSIKKHLDAVFASLDPTKDKITFIFETGGPDLNLPPAESRWVVFQKHPCFMEQVERIINQLNSILIQDRVDLRKLFFDLQKKLSPEGQPISGSSAIQIFVVQYLADKQQEGFDIRLSNELAHTDATISFFKHQIKFKDFYELLFSGNINEALLAFNEHIEYIAHSVQERTGNFVDQVTRIVESGRKVIFLRGRGHSEEFLDYPHKRMIHMIRLNNWQDPDLSLWVQALLHMIRKKNYSVASALTEQQQIALIGEFFKEQFLKSQPSMQFMPPKTIAEFKQKLTSIYNESPTWTPVFVSLILRRLFTDDRARQSRKDCYWAVGDEITLNYLDYAA